MKDQDRCPYCLGALHPALEPGAEPAAPPDPLVSCKRCATSHHEACFHEHGRCCVFACGSLEFVAGEGPRREPGSLHPFLPLGESRVDRQASFLTVQVEHRAREVRQASFRLEMRDTVMCGQALAGTLVAATPEEVVGAGLRLRVEAIVPQAAKELTLYQEAAVLTGRPPRGWLERLRLRSREERVQLLRPGTTRFRFSFQPGLLHYRADLPRDGAFGPWHVLRISAELEAGDRSRATRAHRVLVRHGHARCEEVQQKAIRIRWRARRR